MDQIKKVTWPHAILTICTVFMTFSLLQAHITITARGWIWIPMACIMCLYLSTAVFGSKQFLWLVVYFVVLAMNLISGKSANTNNYIIMNFATLLWAESYPFILKGGIDKKFIRLFVVIELLVVTITAILTIIVDLSIPGVVRQAVTYVNAGNTDVAMALYRLGVCEYGLPHAIPIILPAIIKYYRNRETPVFRRVLSLFIVLLLSYFVFISGVTTAILLSLFVIAGSLLISTSSKKKTISRLAILIVLVLPFVSEEVMLSTLSGIADIVPAENSFHGKIVSIENTIKYDEADGSVESRENTYEVSWESFQKSPIFGGQGSNASGGHSVILDNFGTYGLMGGIPFLLFIFFHLRYIYRILPEDSKLFYFLGVISFVSMLAFKNMSNVYTWLFISVFLPLLLLYESKRTRVR